MVNAGKKVIGCVTHFIAYRPLVNTVWHSKIYPFKKFLNLLNGIKHLETVKTQPDFNLNSLLRIDQNNLTTGQAVKIR